MFQLTVFVSHPTKHIYFNTGKCDGKFAKKLMESIQFAVKERLNLIIEKSNFLSILTDGSQARKTGDDKELVLVRAERNGKEIVQKLYIS